MIFWRGIAVTILFGFVVVYPFVWYNTVVKVDIAERYIKNYRGQEPGDDPWGTPYRVRKISTEGVLNVSITSAGRDKKCGTEDDLRGGYVKSITVEIVE